MPLFLQLLIEKIVEISTITTEDYITIVSTFTALTDMQFNCGACHKKYKSSPERQENHQKRLGCDGSIDPKLVYQATHDMQGSPKVKYQRCIGNFFDEYAMSLIKYFGKYKNGMLPYKGSYYDQPNKFTEVMELIENLIGQNNKEREEKLQRAQGRHGGK